MPAQDPMSISAGSPFKNIKLKNNKKLLNNPTTYDESLYDGYYQSYWTNTDEYYYQLSFKGKNSFGVEQKFVTKYRCTYNNGKTTFKQIAFNKALD